MSKLEQLRNMQAKRNYTIDDIEHIADKMEEELGPAEMWNTLRPGFSVNELMENLIYIAREHDM